MEGDAFLTSSRSSFIKMGFGRSAWVVSASSGGHEPGTNTSPRELSADFRKLHLVHTQKVYRVKRGMRAPFDVLDTLPRHLPAHTLPDTTSDLPVCIYTEDPDD